MTFQKKKFYYEIEMLDDTKIKSLTGKQSYNQIDFTNLVSKLIDYAFNTHKNKKFS